MVAISATSGLAGIAMWINNRYNLKGSERVDKRSKLVAQIKEWVDAEYKAERQTVISDSEMEALMLEYAPEIVQNHSK